MQNCVDLWICQAYAAEIRYINRYVSQYYFYKLYCELQLIYLADLNFFLSYTVETWLTIRYWLHL